MKDSNKYITVAWQKNIGATKYKVEISRNQNTKYKTLKITTKRKMKINGLKKGTRYYIRITPITNISGNTYNGAAAVYETSTKRM